MLGWELEPGDAVFFNMLTVHGSGGVSGTNRRRVLSVRYLGDDMVHAPRRWTTSPPFDGLDAEIEAGAPMDHPLFPTLWTRPVDMVASEHNEFGGEPPCWAHLVDDLESDPTTPQDVDCCPSPARDIPRSTW